MVSHQCVGLLDFIRKLYQEKRVLFMLSGWVDHEILRERAKESQLFPLEQRPINFLNPVEVEELLRRTFGAAGVRFAPDFVESILELTAGHPNLVQKICKLATITLNRQKRVVAVSSDLNEAARTIVDDSSNFKTSWYNPDIVTIPEQMATKEVIDHSFGKPGAWVRVDNLSPSTRQSVLSLIQKQVLIYDRGNGRVRIKGLLLDNFIRDLKSFDPGSAVDRVNVGLFVDYENLEPLFTDNTPPADIAGILRRYADALGNPRALVVAANWERIPRSFPIKTAFRAAGFSPVGPSTVDRRTSRDAADRVIVREIYDRMVDEREGANDSIDVFIVASGDGHFLDYIENMIERFEKRCRLLAWRGHEHLNGAYLDYETKRKEVAVMRGRAGDSDFVVDDLGPWIESLGQAS
jgi:hypothetical protein